MKSPVNFKLILITDLVINKNLVKTVTSACKGGLRAVQLREKHLTAKQLLSLSQKLRTVTLRYNSNLLINDRLDIAMLCNADGLHSPEKGFNPRQIGKENSMIFGRSVHSLNSAKEAEILGFDYIIFGPVFQTPSKIEYGKPQGLGKLKKVCYSVKIPVFAVGGINPERAGKCLDSGAFGVAVIREIILSGNAAKTVTEFKNVLGEL